MTVEVFRESTDAEADARMLADLRTWRVNRHPSSGDQVSLGLEEVDMLLRVAAERDQLRRETCAEPETKYVVRTCAACGHDPHGYLILCTVYPCPCRDGRPKP